MTQAISQHGDRKLLGEYRATISQRSFLAMEFAEGSTAENRRASIVNLAFLVEPTVDLRKLERAVQRLVARHDSLRMSFAKDGDEWRVRVWDRHKTGVIVQDHGELDEDARTELVAEFTGRPIDILNDDLVQFLVARTGKGGDILVVRAHHSVVDGHSMLILTEELLKILLGVPLFGDGVSHADYLREIEDLPPRRQKEIDDYWRRLLFPVLPQPGSGSFGTGLRAPRRVFTSSHYQNFHLKLSHKDFESLAKLAGAPGQTGFSVLFAAFAQTFLDMSGLPGIYIMTIVDRVSSHLKNYVGCAIQFITVRCENPEQLAMGKFAEKLNAQIQQSVAHLPSDAGGIELRFDHEVYRAGGVLRHIACVEVFQNARAKNSAFAGYLETPLGMKQKLGPISITRLPLRDLGPRSRGFELRVRRDSNAVNLEFCYQSNFFSDVHIAEFVHGLQIRLGVAFA